MKIEQIQLLEYAFKCLQEIVNRKVNEDQSVNYQLVIKSSDDVFTAKSLKYNSYGNPVLSKIDQDYSFTSRNIEISPSRYNEKNPLLQVRHIIFNEYKFYDIQDSSVFSDPELLLKQVSDLINGIDNDLENEKIWHDYRSLKYGYKLDFNLDTGDEYKIINILTTDAS